MASEVLIFLMATCTSSLDKASGALSLVIYTTVWWHDSWNCRPDKINCQLKYLTHIFGSDEVQPPKVIATLSLCFVEFNKHLTVRQNLFTEVKLQFFRYSTHQVRSCGITSCRISKLESSIRASPRSDKCTILRVISNGAAADRGYINF